ncbi:hypothetical protein [uncultured Chryseobacterium sp.]|uniref:hypothetical protein n=1 Tax=uncultured Chryseobacterium sp. TaxID=259322 RepID=UPI0025F0885F|nr:hypothetical protein [uncultured Chryseobacterium sp.]
MTRLLPLQINALYLDQPQQIIGQDIRFENIPWMNMPEDVFENPNTPFDTSSVIPRPFSYDNAVYLEKGVHIHFVLPGFFKKFDDQGNLPPAPDRWYIRRGGREWIVESDYIWDVNDPALDRNQTCSYLRGKPEGDFSFSYIGRKYSRREWESKAGGSSEHLGNLTAVGWGSLSFDAHFGNCRSVFGFHDREPVSDESYLIIGWVEGDRTLPVVAGNFIIKTGETNKQEGALHIAVANTLPEALTALILEDLNDEGETLVERLRKEEQIESVLNIDSLSDQKLDWVSRLRHQQHEKQFSVTAGFSGWQVMATDLPVDSTAVIYGIEKLFADDLEQLNRMQRECDDAHHHFYSDLESAYIDWSNYLSDVFLERSAGNRVNGYLAQIEAKIETLQYTEMYCRQLADRIHITTEELQYRIKTSKDIELVIDKLIRRIEDLKAASLKYLPSLHENSDELTIKKELRHLALSKITIEKKNTHNFYEALPPTVIVSTSGKNALVRTFDAGDTIFPEEKYVEIEGRIERFIDKMVRDNMLPVTEVAANLWKTLKVEWHAEFLPKKNGHYLNTADQNFSSDFLFDTYCLDEQNADLIKDYKLDNIAYNFSGNQYYGNSLVDSTLKEYVLGRIEKAVETFREADQNQPIYDLLEQYRAKLERTDLFEFTLSDFNNLMIQRSQALSVLPFIPNGFRNHKKAARALTALLNNHKANISLLSANHLSTFNPLRNGALSISRLRVTDSFGREQKIYPDKIITTKNQTFADRKNWVILPPRVLQPSALDIKFDYHTSDSVKSPVIGWMIPVFINQHLEFFNSEGLHIGAVNDEGQWEPTPFHTASGYEKKTGIEKIENPNLRNMVKWFSKQSKKPGFVAEVIKEIQHNLEHIAPENYQNPSLMETMASLPIAIAKIDYRLVSRGKPVYNVKNRDVVSDHSAHESGLCNIRFPVRFGDVNQYNDGLIGYWHMEEGDFNRRMLYINSQTVSGLSSAARKSFTIYQDIKNGLNSDASGKKLKNPSSIRKTLESAFEESAELADILNTEELEKVSAFVSSNPRSDKRNRSVPFKPDDLISSDMDFLLDRFTALLNPENPETSSIKEENGNSAGSRFESLILLLEQILDEKGEISRPYILKQFTEKGNLIWETLQDLHIIPQENDLQKLAMASKTEDNKGFVTINGPEKSIIALLHPKAGLFVKSGILPEKNISLPYNEIKYALRKIELTLLTSPVVTPKENLQLSLLKDKRYRWSWIDLKKTKKEKLSAENKPVLDRITQDLSLKGLEEKDLDALRTKGLIAEEAFFPDENLYYIDAEKYREWIHRESLTEEDERLVQLIERSKMSIMDFNISNPVIPGLILKEGWVSIKSNQL